MVINDSTKEFRLTIYSKKFESGVNTQLGFV